MSTAGSIKQQPNGTWAFVVDIASGPDGGRRQAVSGALRRRRRRRRRSTRCAPGFARAPISRRPAGP